MSKMAISQLYTALIKFKGVEQKMERVLCIKVKTCHLRYLYVLDIYFFVIDLVKRTTDTNIFLPHCVYLHVLVLTQAEEESRRAPESYRKNKKLV